MTSSSDCAQNGINDIAAPIVPRLACAGFPSRLNPGRTHPMCIGWTAEARCAHYEYAGVGIEPDVHRTPGGQLMCSRKQPQTPETGG